MTSINVVNVSKKYVIGDEENWILKNINYEFESQKITAIMGPSGSGKSTLLEIIGGYAKPTEGKIFYDKDELIYVNDEVVKNERKKLNTMIYQDLNLVNFLTVKDNIELPYKLGKKFNQLNNSGCSELMRRMGVYDKRNRYIDELSGGEKQRVALIRSLLLDVPVLLADEPTGSLDHKNTIEFMNIVREQNKIYNKTVIIVTHDLEVAKLCDRILILSEGVLKGE